jgi:hypothetical protein
MSQRNPLNERYTTEGGRKGTTRKSAASARPKTKAASSVHLETSPRNTKTPKERKAAEKELRDKEKEINSVLERKYFNPPTQEYRQARMAWAFLLVIALLCTVGTWIGQNRLPSIAVYCLLFAAYAGIVGVLIIDFKKIRKLRTDYLQQMSGQIAKERRILEKAQKEAAISYAKGEGPEHVDLSQFIEMPEKTGFFGRKPKKVAATKASEAQATDASEAKGAADTKDAQGFK